MKIALDTSPVSSKSNSAHKVRGVGSYIMMLKDNLAKFDKNNEYIFVDDGKFPNDVDLIHFPYFEPFFISLPFKTKTKFIVTVHDLTPIVFPEHFPSGIKGKLRWQVQKRRLRKASAIVADSDSSKNDINRIVGIPESKIHTVYLAADERFKRLKTEDLGPERLKEKYNLPDNFLLYVGDATWNKNLPRIVEAVKKTKFPVVMAGKIWGETSASIPDNPWNKDLRLVFEQIETDTRFIRLGYVPDDDLVKIYNTADLLLMPSLYEGFGLPVLEAMNCGCPVITSREGSLPEVGGGAVYYVEDALDPRKIADAITALMEDKKLRDEFSKRGLTQAKKFTVKNSIEQLSKIYENTR
jgi:glycosyltransferase involved in cell wall biosynthesis